MSDFCTLFGAPGCVLDLPSMQYNLAKHHDNKKVM